MKSRIFFLTLVLLFFCSTLVVHAQSFETIEIGKGGPPKWSPDGTKLAFVSEGWLCVADAEGKGQIQKIAEVNPYIFEWMSDSEFVVFEKEYPKEENRANRATLRIRKIDIDGRATTVDQDTTFSKTTTPKITRPLVLPDGTVGFYKCKGGYRNWECNDFRIIKQGKLKPDSALKQMIATTEGYPAWGEINLESVDRTIKKKITPGKQYLFPKLSPNGLKILASYGPAEFVLDLNGNVLLDLGKDRPQAPPNFPNCYAYIVDAEWSPDNKKILYYATVEDGHEIYDMDIYIINVDGTGKRPVAVTPGEKEWGASWSPDGTRIAYTGYNSHKIYVIKLD